MFTDVESALQRARARLEGFQSSPAKHASHAAKVLLKFKLLDWQRIDRDALMLWAEECHFLHLLHQRYYPVHDLTEWVELLMQDLVKAQVARQDGKDWLNA